MTSLVARVSAFLLCLLVVCAEGAQTVKETVDKLKRQSASVPFSGLTTEPGSPESKLATPIECPEPVSLDLFKHQIAFEKTQENGTLNALVAIHADVWERGPDTAFAIREPLPGFTTKFRMVYLFGKDGLGDGGGCPAEQNWIECVEKFAGTAASGSVIRTCMTTIDTRSIPAWAPSPNDLLKRRLAEQLRDEIETQWPGAQEIVLRDFNLNDPQITMYLKMPDADYFEGCAFHALREPHCDGWHLFGQTPISYIRNFIFQRPYRLK